MDAVREDVKLVGVRGENAVDGEMEADDWPKVTCTFSFSH